MLRSSCRSIQFMFAVIIVLSLCEMTWGSNASFQRKSTPTKDNSIGILTADLNGDGIPDLIEANDRCNCISVQLANTDGTFRAPVDYTFPFLNQSRTQLATADLNHDGNADVVARTWSINSSSEFVTHILAYLGNGNGTLAAPIDSSFTGGGADMFVADVNSDGNVDAVVSTTDGSFTPHQEIVAVMDGDGHGNFAAPITVYGPTDTGAAPVAIGDFDADGHVDVAFQRTYGTCTNGGCSSNTLGILYGNGAGTFTEKDVFTAAGDFIGYIAGDLDQNGTTDVVITLDTPQSSGQNVAALYGTKARTMNATLLKSNLPPVQSAFFVSVAVSDFNGDLMNDFALLGFDTGNSQIALNVFLRNANGSFTQEKVPFIPDIGDVGNLVVGDFNRDRKPDLAFASVAQATAGNPTQATQINDYLNTTSGGHFDGCMFPASSHGIHLCGPTNGASVISPVKFTAAGDWFQNLRKSELWIDGVKVAEQHFGWEKSQWFEQRRQLAAGSHKATFFTAGSDNQLQKQSVTFSVSGTQACSHPSAAGVHVCSPLSGSINGSPVLAQASATVTGTISRMELWVDGVKQFTATGSTTLQKSISLSPGVHRFTFFAFNTTGTKWSAMANATVQ